MADCPLLTLPCCPCFSSSPVVHFSCKKACACPHTVQAAPARVAAPKRHCDGPQHRGSPVAGSAWHRAAAHTPGPGAAGTARAAGGVTRLQHLNLAAHARNHGLPGAKWPASRWAYAHLSGTRGADGAWGGRASSWVWAASHQVSGRGWVARIVQGQTVRARRSKEWPWLDYLLVGRILGRFVFAPVTVRRWCSEQQW